MTGPAVAAIPTRSPTAGAVTANRRRWDGRRAGGGAAALAASALVLRAAGGWLPGQVEVGLATLLVLWLPGWALNRALGDRLRLSAVAAAGLAPLAGLALWAPAAATGFAFGLPLWAVVAAVLAATAVLIGLAPRTQPAEPGDRRAIVLLAAGGALIGARWQAPLTGDALFHAGVVRKLAALPGLSLRAVWPFQHGHPHAGYAFPLLHTAQAGAAWITAIDPSTAYRDLTPAFAAMVPLAAYPLGHRLAGRRGGWLAGLLALWAGASNGGLISYSQQPRFVVTAILLPGLLLLLTGGRPHGRAVVAAVAIAAGLCTILHVTYALPLLVMIAAVALAERTWPVLAASAAACAAVAGWVWLVALRGPHEHQFLVAPGSFFVSLDGTHLALSGPQIFDNRPEFALAAAGAAWLAWQTDDDRRPLAWATGAVLALAALPGPTPLLEAIAGPGQATRTWEMIPAALMLAVLLARPPGLSRRALVAIAAGSLAVAGAQLTHTWAATAMAIAAALAVLAAAVVRRRLPAVTDRRLPAAAIAATALATMIGPLCFTGWPVLREAVLGKHQTTVSDVTPGLVRYLRARQRGIPVVLAPYASGTADNFAGTAYALAGNATVYTVAESSAHTESELHDQPIVRRELVTEFLSPATSNAVRDRILRRFDVSFVVAPVSPSGRSLVAQLDRNPILRRAYTDPPSAPGGLRFAVYRVLR